MSISRRIAFGASAMWLSRGVSVLLGLLLLPVLFRHLPREELGVWMVLGQSWAALGIFDLGLAATLVRRIAFAKGKSGADPSAPLTEETKAEIADLVFIGNRAYHVLAVFAFVVSFAAGFYYFQTLHLSTIPLSRVWLAWGIICLSQAIGVWANVWNSVLIGIGFVGWGLDHHRRDQRDHADPSDHGSAARRRIDHPGDHRRGGRPDAAAAGAEVCPDAAPRDLPDFRPVELRGDVGHDPVVPPVLGHFTRRRAGSLHGSNFDCLREGGHRRALLPCRLCARP